MNEKSQRVVSSPAPRRSAEEHCQRRLVKMGSEMMGISGDSSTDLVEENETVGTGLQMTDTVSREWTDAKHSLYLNSMEASFVRQLHSHEYRSIDLGQQSSMVNQQDPSSLHSNAHNSIPSGEVYNLLDFSMSPSPCYDWISFLFLSFFVRCLIFLIITQFKVLQGGNWKRINFERAQTKLKSVDDSRLLQENQWIRHFRSTGKHQVTLANMQENKSSSSESTHSKGHKKAIHDGATSCPNELHVGLCHQNSIEGSAEVSDQNFVDEEHEGKQISRLCQTKKTKTLII